jgi:hypothetical protein
MYYVMVQLYRLEYICVDMMVRISRYWRAASQASLKLASQQQATSKQASKPAIV